MEIIKSLSLFVKEYSIPEILLAVFTAAIIIIVIFFILYGTFLAIDSWFACKKVNSARVITKTITPGFYTMRGYYPDTFYIIIEIDDVEVEVNLAKSFYNAYQINEIIKVEFVRGRISGQYYVRNLVSM